MRERIYTIPLTDVMAPGLGCPFCLLVGKAEDGLLRMYLEGMLIDIEWRGRVLRDWLCRRHLAGLGSAARKPGGAIVVQALLDYALGNMGSSRGSLPRWGSSCLACQDLERTLLHHVEAYIHAWFAEREFRRPAMEADPFCLPHLALLYRQAGTADRRQREEFRQVLLAREREALDPLKGQVDWFVRKFDARFRDESWNGTEDAVERAINVLAGGEAGI